MKALFKTELDRSDRYYPYGYWIWGWVLGCSFRVVKELTMASLELGLLSWCSIIQIINARFNGVPNSQVNIRHYIMHMHKFNYSFRREHTITDGARSGDHSLGGFHPGRHEMSGHLLCSGWASNHESGSSELLSYHGIAWTVSGSSAARR